MQSTSRRARLEGLLLVALASLAACADPAVPESEVAPKIADAALVAFPLDDHTLALAFSEPVDEGTALEPSNYETVEGLEIVGVEIDPDDPLRFVAETSQMDGAQLVVDAVVANGVLDSAGNPLEDPESPPFLQGIVDILGISGGEFQGTFASASCHLACYPKQMVETLGFTFVQQASGGEWSGIKVQADALDPQLEEAATNLPMGFGAHALFTGGRLEDVDGETRLIDVGFTESSLHDDGVLISPAPYSIQVEELPDPALHGVVVQLSDATIVDAWEDDDGHRRFVLKDESGQELQAMAMPSVESPPEPDQHFSEVVGTLHHPSADHDELLVFFDSHLVP